ncbi:12337_t:CDS:2 [Dentiscutata erythropus]|uniref:12337_t:CDS:1 n=1 Tax=Dentiscutata erythropus TaxID=1348616 RepID=A0A9N9CKE5_9GLOM|nr:12337_t:CDS:2 [Dentiscutata erythropus]
MTDHLQQICRFQPLALELRSRSRDKRPTFDKIFGVLNMMSETTIEFITNDVTDTQLTPTLVSSVVEINQDSKSIKEDDVYGDLMIY